MTHRLFALARPAALARLAALALAMGAMLAGPAATSAQQIQAVDPDKAIDSDLVKATPPATSTAAPAPQPSIDTGPAAAPVPQPTAPAAPTGTYQQDDLVGAAEGVFGKGASGLADVIRDILKKQGQPNAYIVGREGGAAIGVGLRYGSGTLHHKIEGQKPVYWTGPSIGFDAGANASSTFVLVYNLYNTEDIYHRFGAGEGTAYLVGGFNVSYLRRGDVVLIPVRSGVGLRLGVNAGYMKITKKSRWFPF